MDPIALALAALLNARPAAPPPAPPQPVWLGEQMPLPLAVKTPEDLTFKALAEKHYLIFNLLAEGKVSWDAGDYATAANKWEALLRTPDLPADVAAGISPFAAEARKRAGGAAAQPVAVPTPATAAATTSRPDEPNATPATVTVKGTVQGGGPLGPGGAVVWLEREGAATPRPRAGKKLVIQKNKAFEPRVLAVPVGTSVEFRNDDDIFHDVFSLSKPNQFDLGLYKGGTSKSQVFDSPGPVQLLCNIHATMQGWIYVVKSAWYAQADGNGAFAIKGVPPGDYTVHVWHEAAARPTEHLVHVEGPTSLALTVGGDAAKQPFVPDKYGKPRQVQLGY